MKKLLALILLLFFLCAPVTGYTGNPLTEAQELNQKVIKLYQAGRYEEAIPYAKQALEIREKTLGREHPDVARSLNNLAELYRTTGRYAEAEPLFKRSLEIWEKTLGQEHPLVATNLNNLALLYETTGRYAEAEPLYKRALEIKEKVLGPEHPDVARSLNNLAGLYRATGRYAEAEPLYKRSLQIREKALGREHPDVATSLNNLALLYHATGRYAEAEPLYKRALAIWEKVLGREHPDVATGLNNLALLYHATGRYAQAEPLYQRALKIYEKVHGPEHPDVATGLNNLAVLYHATGRYAEAEPLYKRALAISEKALGREHPAVALGLNNLALLYDTTGRYAEAEPLYKRTLAILEKVLGREHPDVALSLNNLAELYRTTGRYAEAEPLYKRTLAILEKVLGREHPDVARSLNNLALLYANTEKHPEGHKLFTEGAAINEKTKDSVFLLLSDRQKINYMKQKEGNIHVFITHTAQFMNHIPAAVTDNLNAWLRWKGAVLEAQGRYLDALTYSDNPEIKKKFEELTNTRRELARLQLSKLEKLSFEDYRNRLQELEKKKEALEVELSQLSKDYSLERTVGKADVPRISQILPKDSVYMDFARIKLYDFKARKWGEARYLVFVLIPEKDPAVKLLDIKDAETADKHIKAYHREITESLKYQKPPKESVLKKEARALYDIVIKPLEPYIKNKKALYLSPDGNLNLIPFEVLVTPQGKYLMEDYLINYVAAGRDIIRFTDTAAAKGEALILADPDYDLGLKEKEKVAQDLRVAKSLRGDVSRDARGLHFGRLPGTRQEADAAAKVLKEKYRLKVYNYQDKKALEEVLFSTPSPRILHLSTHGYFLKDEEVKDFKGRGLGLQELDKLPDTGIENPMLRSGIALAGVNASLIEGRDDGLVSAEKILGLRLKGTELVVLSACETGVGEVQNGEGVFGLKRAFILSGAKTVVMSLWSVPDEETKELMTEFYTLMSQGKSKAEALKQAKTNMMKKNRNPFFWGAFVMVGKPE